MKKFTRIIDDDDNVHYLPVDGRYIKWEVINAEEIEYEYEYEYERNDYILTKCNYYHFANVGSCLCSSCQYYISEDEKNKTVYCSYKHYNKEETMTLKEAINKLKKGESIHRKSLSKNFKLSNPAPHNTDSCTWDGGELMSFRTVFADDFYIVSDKKEELLAKADELIQKAEELKKQAEEL